jgi:hypothetical protein
VTPESVTPGRTPELLAALAQYRVARLALLNVLGLPTSNRDPLAEFSEQLVQALMGGTLAASRVQAGHDLVLDDGALVQVKYLANTGALWVNEHPVRAIPGVTWYALVVVENFSVVSVVAFPLATLTAVGAALRKRHPDQDVRLDFTRANFHAIRDNPDRFRELGVRLWLPPL